MILIFIEILLKILISIHGNIEYRLNDFWKLRHRKTKLYQHFFARMCCLGYTALVLPPAKFWVLGIWVWYHIFACLEFVPPKQSTFEASAITNWWYKLTKKHFFVKFIGFLPRQKRNWEEVYLLYSFEIVLAMVKFS